MLRTETAQAIYCLSILGYELLELKMNSSLPNKDKPYRDAKWALLGMTIALGVVLTFAFGTWPVLKTLQARGWNSTPCVVDYSYVFVSSGAHGNSYYATIEYTYTVAEHRYTSLRYKFGDASLNSHDRQRRLSSIDIQRARKPFAM